MFSKLCFVLQNERFSMGFSMNIFRWDGWQVVGDHLVGGRWLVARWLVGLIKSIIFTESKKFF